MKGVQYYGTKSLGSFRPKIWELVPVDLKNTEFLEAFNSAIKIWSGAKRVSLQTL